MTESSLRSLARRTCALAAAALAGCASLDPGPAVTPPAQDAKAGAQTPPARPIANFSAGLRCMDSLLLEYGTRDVTVIVEDLVDQKKANAGTKDMLISAVSDMTRRSRAIRLVAYGQDPGHTQGLLSQALKRDHFAAVPQYALRGSVRQFDDTVVRSSGDGPAAASVLGIDLTMLATQDLTVVPGIASRNQVVRFKQGKSFDNDAVIRKFGIDFSLSTGTPEGQGPALRTLVELASIELFGRLAKVPYWTCLGVTDQDAEVAAEIRDWYDAMVARPAELIEYFQAQLRMRRVYDGPVDGVVNPQLKEAVARYREALGLSREPKLSQDFLRAYLRANHRELEAKVKPVPAAAQPDAQAVAQAAPAPASGPLALKVGTANHASRFARGEAVQLTVRPSRDAHVYCFLQDEKRQISRFFPNRFQRDSRVNPVQGLSLPGAMRFEIRMNAKGVRETVSCFATERDVLANLPQGLNGGDFAPLPVASLEQLRSAFADATGGVLAQEYFHVQAK